LGIKETFSTRRPAKEYVKSVKDAGGIGFLAHPHEKRDSMKEHPPYPWTEWDCPDFTGIEIWNHMSEWMENLTEQNKYQAFLHPLKTIIKPPEETLRVWDELSIARKVVGIGGIDAHAHKVNLLGFFEVEVFPYKVLFKSIRTHILTEQNLEIKANPVSVEKAKNVVLQSLREGKCFVSNYYHGDATGFRFFAESDNKKIQMGDEVLSENPVILNVYLPGKTADIRLIHNGKMVESLKNIEAKFIVHEKGVYRVEVFLEANAWIFSNHIRIK
ncbi:MAG: histidinol-phosphatase, partial [Ignavibacteria bacterium]|nr:histidinol-phosphatase [Ignavibacteria bacterium]